jgi:hypothetical protein
MEAPERHVGTAAAAHGEWRSEYKEKATELGPVSEESFGVHNHHRKHRVRAITPAKYRSCDE